MQPIVVYDTHILISGMLWGGKPRDCMALAQQGKVKGLTCPEIISEFSEKLTIKLEQSVFQTEKIVSELLSFLESVRITDRLTGATTDPDDNKVIECAVVGGATHIISGDRKHLLRLGSYQGILIVTASDFLGEFA